MTPQEHKVKHQELHKSLDELLADFVGHTERLPSKTTVMELVEWSHKQTQNPSVKDNQDVSRDILTSP